jgi:hypothetical protein
MIQRWDLPDDPTTVVLQSKTQDRETGILVYDEANVHFVSSTGEPVASVTALAWNHTIRIEIAEFPVGHVTTETARRVYTDPVNPRHNQSVGRTTEFGSIEPHIAVVIVQQAAQAGVHTLPPAAHSLYITALTALRNLVLILEHQDDPAASHVRQMFRELAELYE